MPFEKKIIRRGRDQIMEVIPFRQFMNPSYVEKKGKPVYGVVTWFSVTSILAPSPIILKGYALVLVAGFVLISIAFLEKYLAMSGMGEIASAIINFIKGVMPWALVAALIIFVLNNPLL